jgi:hypothetical protein
MFLSINILVESHKLLVFFGFLNAIFELFERHDCVRLMELVAIHKHASRTPIVKADEIPIDHIFLLKYTLISCISWHRMGQANLQKN